MPHLVSSNKLVDFLQVFLEVGVTGLDTQTALHICKKSVCTCIRDGRAVKGIRKLNGKRGVSNKY